MKILLIEDDEDSAEMLAYFFSTKKWDLAIASTGALAIAMFPSVEPDIILLDLTLPDMDGVNVIRRMRALGRTLPPVLVTSACTMDAVDAGVRDAGAIGYLRKPYRLSELVTTIQAAL